MSAILTPASGYCRPSNLLPSLPPNLSDELTGVQTTLITGEEAAEEEERTDGEEEEEEDKGAAHAPNPTLASPGFG